MQWPPPAKEMRTTGRPPPTWRNPLQRIMLTSLCARGLVLKVKAPDDVKVTLRNDYEPVEGEKLAWRLPDLAFASEAWALLELEVPAVDGAGGTPASVPITVSPGQRPG